MKALRNFEALFVAIIGLACAANYAFDDGINESKAPAAYASAVQAAPIQGSHVVVVSAKRMSDAEKQASLAAERNAAKAGNI